MPLHIQNQALYADRTVQDWHRRTMPRDHDAIDLDLMGVCHHGYCREPLYFIESTTNPNKPNSILRKLAQKADAVGLVIFHDTEQITGYSAVHDPLNLSMQVQDGSVSTTLFRLLTVIRSYHEIKYHNGG